GVYLVKPGDSGDKMAVARTLSGIELVLAKDEVCKQFDLPADREGDFAVFSDRNTVVGARREDHDLTQLAGHRLRSHGGIGEQKGPVFLSRPLHPHNSQRPRTGPPHNFALLYYPLNSLH